MDTTLKVIGITGGSGTGKSSVTRYFAQQNIAVIDADLIAREVCLPNTPCWRNPFGVRRGYTKLRRFPKPQKMGKLVFVDSKRLDLLVAITHKYIKEEIFLRIDAYRDNPVITDEEGNESPLRAVVIDAPFCLRAACLKYATPWLWCWPI
jgi:dephospho-CoA kinase